PVGVPPLLTSLISPVAGLLGIQWAEVNSGVTLPNIGQLGVLQVVSGVDPGWYAAQPTWQIMRAQSALAYSRGSGVIIADINSQVDSTHPAIAGHLTAGYDFVTGRPTTGYSVLNQSSASFVDQSSASFVDQSSASFVDQSSASFVDNTG